MPRMPPLTCLLRPLAAPRTVTCRQHLRFSTAARLCAEKQATTSPPQDRKHSNEPIADALSSISSTPKPESALETTQIKLKYHVQRSGTKNLPIYTDCKRGGNLRETVIRKITGDSGALRNEIRVYLKKREHEIRVNPLTQHVIIKGHCPEKVKQFLEERGF